ncbi:hypothetical protein ROHU_025979 [Labeo rohita]|uniref:Uncharacterized protein n=1 Tax=Labeo rohita TaxID=84645 RepID=A0A498MCK0_LABRO|nr:hypothetical protein ROHU_032096 [Labeo rohita]RXN18839.1 hypothetical protein ROHU_025979 [Labeo rohita]
MAAPSCERGQWHSGTVVHGTADLRPIGDQSCDPQLTLETNADAESGYGDPGMTVNIQIASQGESFAAVLPIP